MLNSKDIKYAGPHDATDACGVHVILVMTLVTILYM